MKAKDANIALFHGLPEIHKQGMPLRPIISLPGTATYNLAKELWEHLHHLLKDLQHSIDNSCQFLEKIRNMKLGNDEMMVSFDVTALFTSINRDLTIETLLEMLESKEQIMERLTRQNICELIDLSMTTYFQFNGKPYEQSEGTLIASPISGFITESVMQRLERTIMPSIEPKLWVRYVDDTFVIMKRDRIDEIYQKINNVFRNIKFTMESEDFW